MPDNIEKLAELAGCHRRTLERWRRDGAPWPRDGDDLAEWSRQLHAWAKERRRRNKTAAPAAPNAIPPSPLDHLDRLRSARADIAELERDELRGDLVRRELVAAEWRRRVLAVRAKLLALPRTIAGRAAASPPEVVEAEAMAIVRDALADFAAGGDLTPPP